MTKFIHALANRSGVQALMKQLSYDGLFFYTKFLSINNFEY
ncbi:hypothetical protein AO365_0902 [Moraxella catarrhalis]|nr:hypothetical protein AO365_0902 [Moraxella catarrhalis]